jgi:hypothetical protein
LEKCPIFAIFLEFSNEYIESLLVFSLSHRVMLRAVSTCIMSCDLTWVSMPASARDYPAVVRRTPMQAPNRRSKRQSTFPLKGRVSTCVNTCSSTFDSELALACQRKIMHCHMRWHANAGTESQVKLQVDSHVKT